MKTCPSCALVFPDESTFCFLSGHTLEAPPDPLVGTTMGGRFLIEALLSETAWSKLYAARYRLRLEPCCLKLFSTPLDEDSKRRFETALKCARRYSHSNLTEVVGGGLLEDGSAYLVHPRNDSRPLTTTLVQGPLEVTKALGISLQILTGLGRIHDFGGTHGSLRPSNIMLSPSGHVELVHTGLGRVLLRDVWEDTPRALSAQLYLAPELSSQQRHNIAADIYAAGLVAVHMLSGKPPHQAANVSALLAQKRSDDAPPWSTALGHVPEPIRIWLQSLTATAPQARPATAHEAIAALQEACAEAAITPLPDPGAPAATAPAGPDKLFKRWITLRTQFEKMVKISFPDGPTGATKASLQAIQGRVQTLTELSQKADGEHARLHEILTRARQGRERIAMQMAELNATAKQIRKALHPLDRAATAAEEDDGGEDYPAKARQLHRELVGWEGRSGFAEPYRELAAAYRAMADLMDAWYEVRSEQLRREQQAAETREQLVQVDGQLEELRDALRVHESNLGAEIDASQSVIAELGQQTDKLNFELIDLASRFSAPLRAKPELGPCFRELEKTV